MPMIDPFHTIAISRHAYAMAAAGHDVIHMEFGQPSTGAPRLAIEAAHHVLDHDAMGYWESPELKQRICRHYARMYGVTIRPEQVLLTCGASPALVLALVSCFSPGARVATACPGYVAYRNALKTLSMQPVEVRCGAGDRFQISAKRIAQINPAPEGLIIASPANPTGTVLGLEEMKQIVAVCRDRHIRIISDEIYHGLTYDEPAHSILEIDPSAVVINSFSKYFSMAGWRLGWLVVPEELVDAAQARIGNLFLSPPSLSQHAALAAFDATQELDGHLETYRQNRAILLGVLPRLGLARIAPPDGAFYIYADIGHLTHDSFTFCKQLLSDTGVATATGIDFDPEEGGKFMRFSFSVSTERIKDAISRILPWFERYQNTR